MVVRLNGAHCPCGRRGCVEAYAGRGAMELHARRLVDEEGRHTRLFKIMERRGKPRLSSGVWEEALATDDALAHELIDRAMAALAAGVASAINLLDVEAVVVGGGLGTRFGQPYADRLLEEMRPHLFVDERPPVVLAAALGDLGGAIGATLIVPAHDPVAVSAAPPSSAEPSIPQAAERPAAAGRRAVRLRHLDRAHDDARLAGLPAHPLATDARPDRARRVRAGGAVRDPGGPARRPRRPPSRDGGRAARGAA